MKLSIILPSRNEELLIRDTLKSFCNYLKKKHYDFEILVVINGSTDRTEEIVNIFSNTYKQVKILKSQSGYGHALKKGLREAKGQYLVIYNVDFYDFRLLDLIDIDMYGRDLIVGSKRAHWSEDMRPLYRKLIAQFFNLYLKSIHGFKGSDTHGIKLIKRKVVKKILPKCKTNSGIFDTELVIRIQKDGYKIADFPVVVKEIRSSRFKNRFSKTPFDILDLHRALKS